VNVVRAKIKSLKRDHNWRDSRTCKPSRSAVQVNPHFEVLESADRQLKWRATHTLEGPREKGLGSRQMLRLTTRREIRATKGARE